jgi:hypothetical protein
MKGPDDNLAPVPASQQTWQIDLNLNRIDGLARTPAAQLSGARFGPEHALVLL